MYLSRQRFVFLRISTFSKAGTYLTNSKSWKLSLLFQKAGSFRYFSKKQEAFVTFSKSWKLSLLFQKAGSFRYFGGNKKAGVGDSGFLSIKTQLGKEGQCCLRTFSLM
jgi:hypothetical protein